MLRFSARPQGWKGPFGFVTFRLHPVFVDGKIAYYIRTDASDQSFAQARGLVFVPKLASSRRWALTVNGWPSRSPRTSTSPRTSRAARAVTPVTRRGPSSVRNFVTARETSGS